MNKNKPIAGIVVAMAAMLLYANTIHHGYVLDDITVVGQNHLVQQGIRGIPELLKTSYWYGYNGTPDLGYRPLSLIMFAIEWQLSPGNAELNHLVNILLFGATGLLLFITLTKFFENRTINIKKEPVAHFLTFSLSHFLTIPFIASMLYVAHPIHTEVVDNIKSRDEMLAFFFSLFTIYFVLDFIRKNKKSKLFLSLFCFFLALISKENAITIAAVVPAVIYFFTPASTKTMARVTATFALVIIGYIALRFILPEGFTFRKGMPVPDNTLAAAPDIISRLATAVMLLGKYLMLLFFPQPLISDYSFRTFSIVNWGDWRVIASLCVYLMIIFYALKTFTRKNIFSFAILFFILTFSIVSNIVFLVGATVAERFLYTPSLGFCIAVAAFAVGEDGQGRRGAGEEGSRGERESRNFLRVSRSTFLPFRPSLAITAAIVLLFSVKTISRNNYWKDNLTLFSEDIKAAPQSCKLNYYYAVSLLDKVIADAGMSALDKETLINEAIGRLRAAMAVYNNFTEAYKEMGYGYYLKGDLATAINYYDTASRFNSRNPSLLNNYGVALNDMKQYDKALALLQQAIALNPFFAEAYNNAGSCCNGMGRYGDAVPYLKKAIELKPTYLAAYKNIARSLANLKQYDDAIAYLNTALTLTPDDSEVYLYLGLSYKYKGDGAAAQKYLQRAEELKKR